MSCNYFDTTSGEFVEIPNYLLVNMSTGYTGSETFPTLTAAKQAAKSYAEQGFDNYLVVEAKAIAQRVPDPVEVKDICIIRFG